MIFHTHHTNHITHTNLTDHTNYSIVPILKFAMICIRIVLFSVVNNVVKLNIEFI